MYCIHGQKFILSNNRNHMKKQILIFALFCLNQSLKPTYLVRGTIPTPFVTISRTDKIADMTLAYVLSAVIAGKILYDISWHNQYSNCVKNWYQTTNHFIQYYNIQSVTDKKFIEIQNHINLDDLLKYNLWIDSSYNNWLCPWNWTNSQKTTLYICQTVAILVLYADIVANNDQLTKQEIVQALQSKFIITSIYPLIQSGIMLDSALEFIASNKHDFCNSTINNLLQELKPFLIEYKNILRSNKDYIAEIQTKKTHDLQQELIQATRSTRY